MQKIDVRTRVSAPLLLATTLGLILAVAVQAAELLDPLSQPQFVNPLPVPPAMSPAAPGGNHYDVSMTQFRQSLGLRDPHTGDPLLTTVWGYNGTYPARTIEARVGTPVTVRWTNDLYDDHGTPLPHLLPVDTSVHWAHPMNYPASGVPVVTHLHGGHTESESDGLPDQWFTPGFGQTGMLWAKETFVYDNDQEPGTLWYHDHALGITRLNVYAGLAGFYLLRDDWEDGLNLPGPSPKPGDPPGMKYYEIPIAIQDRMFTADGELYYPSEPEVPGAPDPSVLPEFFGDVILVNGQAWPVLDVEPRKYRFRFLNGSDSRFYKMWLAPKGEHMDANEAGGGSPDSGPLFHQIGTDNGLLYAPVAMEKLLLGPGERADVVIDFADYRGRTLVLRNNARSPFPMGEVVDPRTTGRLMAFRVSGEAVEDPSSLPSVLRPAPVPSLGTEDNSRQLVLFEAIDEFGRLRPQLGTVEDGALMWEDPITENPRLHDVEVWEIYNGTMDAHPIHLHLVSFQILSRQRFKADQDPDTGALSDIRLLGNPKGPEENEEGWKDTAIMYPGEVTRVIAKFDRAGLYVWHCHILSHEDHEMMRPYEVIAPPEPEAAAALPAAAGGDQTRIRFRLESSSAVDVSIFDIQGRRVRAWETRSFAAGDQEFAWDGRDDAGRALASGVYFYRVSGPEVDHHDRVILVSRP